MPKLPKLDANTKAVAKVITTRILIPVAATAVAIVVANKIDAKLNSEN